MLATRIIARLDIKGENVVKGIRMEGLRVIGSPIELARKYAEEGAHEIFYCDAVASLYGRNQLCSLLVETSEKVFCPITVGGGLNSENDVVTVLHAGADKIAINTIAMREPTLIRLLAESYGSQAIVVSVQAKQTPSGWEAYAEGGRTRTGKDAVKWAREAVGLGAGEILLTSIDQEGTMKGYDLDLIRACSDLPVPLVACGGCGSVQDVLDALDAGADAVALASALHYGKVTIHDIEHGIAQRELRAKRTGTG